MAIPSTQRTSMALARGSTMALSPSARAASVMGSTPRTGCSAPLSESSPTNATSLSAAPGISRLQASSPTAMGRSKLGPSFLRSAGARLTVMRSSGILYPLFKMAAFTRSRDSRTVVSGRPTISKAGMPKLTFTSARTGKLSMPAMPKLVTMWSTEPHPFVR